MIAEKAGLVSLLMMPVPIIQRTSTSICNNNIYHIYWCTQTQNNQRLIAMQFARYIICPRTPLCVVAISWHRQHIACCTFIFGRYLWVGHVCGNNEWESFVKAYTQPQQSTTYISERIKTSIVAFNWPKDHDFYSHATVYPDGCSTYFMYGCDWGWGVSKRISFQKILVGSPCPFRVPSHHPPTSRHPPLPSYRGGNETTATTWAQDDKM